MESEAPLQGASKRRSLKFHPGPNARHFLAFDPAISKYDRMILFAEIFAQIHRLIDTPSYAPPTYAPEHFVELRVLTDPCHPAFGQIGLFAKKTIPSNTVVTPYTGFIEILSTSCSSRTYTMGFGSRGDDYALDAEFTGNYGRFANDPRGVEGHTANLSAESRFSVRGEAYTALVTRRIVNAGEEILMSYGKAHSLTPSAWAGPGGDVLTRYRIGGVTPFPKLAPLLRMERTTGGALTGGEAVPFSSSSFSPFLSSSFSSSASSSPSSMELLWECPQCGIWSVGSPTPTRVDFCAQCRTPRLGRARLVAVYCTPPLGNGEAHNDVTKTIDEAPFERLNHTTKHYECHKDNQIHTGSEKMISDRNQVNINKNNTNSQNHTHNGCISSGSSNHSTSGNGGSSVSFASEHVDWPMNVPFLPWQVWDAAIPISAVGRHARFETHESLFLYAVAAPNEDVTQQSKRNAKNMEGQSIVRRRGRKPRVRRRIEDIWPLGATDRVCASVDGPSEPSRTEYLFYINESIPVGVHNEPKGEGTPHDTPKPNGNAYKRERRGEEEYDTLEKMEKDDNEETKKEEEEEEEEDAMRGALRSLLHGIHRRIFAGRAYHRGEPVAAVGGTIRPINDPRRRPDMAVLEIPLRHFIPSKVRHRLAAAVTKEEMEEVATLADLARRLDDLSLVVTNEMMYCPCLVPDGDQSARHSLLQMCNVMLTWTVDGLGCPHIAAIALRNILPFEPLLARIAT